MKVHLAGFNVDTAVLEALKNGSGEHRDITPEVISASYARISRDPRPIHEIRKDAREEVEKARRSNSTIIFKMGHHSVAEHAVFNLDIIGISRLAMEELEKFRLCSYTEKSQRYIKLESDFVVPDELKDTPFEGQFIQMVEKQNRAYEELFAKLKVHVFKMNRDMAGDPKNLSMIEGWAKEDARYVTPLAACAQVGMTVNARNLELLLRRFASHPLREVRKLGGLIYEEVADIAPSIVIFHKANDRDSKTYPELKYLADRILTGDNTDGEDEVELLGYTKDGDDIIAAALLHSVSSVSFGECLSSVKSMPEDKKRDIFKTSWKNLQFYDSVLREFEYADLTYGVVLSAACFGQMKRHRMSTITSQPYDIHLGVTVPEAVARTGMDSIFKGIIRETEGLYSKIIRELPIAAQYILTNSHRRRILVHLNAREMYHISRLREDAHAQWDIRNIAEKMTALAKDVMPLTFGLTGGKDRYNEIYKSVYGQSPSVTESVLPGARKIKA